MPVIAVAAGKGGIGKTTIAYELAAALDGVLVDLDFDGGGATAMWGYDIGAFQHAPLLDAFERGPTGPPPKPKIKRHQPALVPGHSDLGASTIPDDLVADCLLAWADVWPQRYVVCDTHPGANSLTDGAMQAADLVVVPVVLATRELDALQRMLGDFAGYRLLLAPNKVPPSPPRRHVERLTALSGGYPVAPPISEHRWLARRVRRAAVVLQPNPGRQLQTAAIEFRDLAASVEKCCD
jgi:chromosome partitioning protein